LVATGGTASVLALMHLRLPRFDRERIEAVSLDAAQVAEWTARLWALPLAARREIVGLPPERADIILFGVAIFEGIMETFRLAPLRPSTRGLRFGALLEPAP
jgi:exopolyphosphatase/guanosine-5'-triphosphate,3'-diphosphate pyrophosphatase